MKHTKNVAKTLILLSLILVSSTMFTTANAATWPNLPPGAVTMTVAGGSSAYLTATLSGVPSGYSVTSGSYPTWCGNAAYDIETGPYAVYLYSSESTSLPASISEIHWPMVNYIINHRIGDDPFEVQLAIWAIISDIGPEYSHTDAWAMIAAAEANPTYKTGPGDILAVICITSDWKDNVQNEDTSIQPVLLEIRTTTTSTQLSSSIITIGQSVTDTAIVARTATGQVDFQVSTDGTNFATFSTKTLSGSNPSTATSDSYTPMAAGTYYFRAVYQGNPNYFGSQSGDNEEILIVNLATPAITTTLSQESLTLGQTIHDSATVIGLDSSLPAPTGTVTFWVSTDAAAWSPVGGAVPLIGDTATSIDYTPPATGTYYFQAIYSGDSNYNSVSSGVTEEMFTTTKATPAITTILSKETLTLGESIHDTAVVTGLSGSGFPAPTGTVTFWVSPDATNWAQLGTEVPLVGSAVDSIDYTPPAVGIYYFQARYSGDSNYNPVISGATAELFTATKAMPTIVTITSTTTLTLGQSIHDTAIVSGISGSSFPTPTGTVKFFVSSDANNWAQLGSPVTLVNGQANSIDYTPLAAGTYYFQAAYSGDSNYNAVISEATAEEFVTTKGTPTVTTELKQSQSCTDKWGCHSGCSYDPCGGWSKCGSSCTTSYGSVTDTAIVTGLGGSFPTPTGTVIFQVSTDGGVTWTTYGTSKTLTNGKATSDVYTPTQAITYYFRAVYYGDSNYLGAQSGDKEEPLIIKTCKYTTTTTTCLSKCSITLGESITDKAFVTKGATGQVRFEVSTDGINFVQYGSVKTLSGGYRNSATSDPYTPTQAGTYYFRAVYLGNSKYLGSQSGDRDEILTVKQPCTSGSGYSPGYWKNHQCSWQGNRPSDSFNTVFRVSIKIDCDRNPTLLEVLQSQGGGVNALGRQAVAALLNAQNTHLHYPLTKSQVISLVHDAIVSENSATIDSLKMQLERYNSL